MAPGPLDELPDWALELLHGARAARLGFVDDADRPRVLPVTFALAVWSRTSKIWTSFGALAGAPRPPRSRTPCV